MNDFLNSLGRRSLAINAVGYLVILVLFIVGPPMGGFVGQATKAYLLFYPAYYLIVGYYQFRKNDGGES